jgi:hypothetical protein
MGWLLCFLHPGARSWLRRWCLLAAAWPLHSCRLQLSRGLRSLPGAEALLIAQP